MLLWKVCCNALEAVTSKKQTSVGTTVLQSFTGSSKTTKKYSLGRTRRVALMTVSQSQPDKKPSFHWQQQLYTLYVNVEYTPLHHCRHRYRDQFSSSLSNSLSSATKRVYTDLSGNEQWDGQAKKTAKSSWNRETAWKLSKKSNCVRQYQRTELPREPVAPRNQVFNANKSMRE